VQTAAHTGEQRAARARVEGSAQEQRVAQREQRVARDGNKSLYLVFVGVSFFSASWIAFRAVRTTSWTAFRAVRTAAT
jgi:hypothetical protein